MKCDDDCKLIWMFMTNIIYPIVKYNILHILCTSNQDYNFVILKSEF